MKTLMTTLTMTLMSLLLTNGAFADAADDVTAAEMDSRAQEDAGNIDGYFKYMVPQFTIFPPTSGLLSEAPEKAVTQARLDAGMNFNMQMRNFDVKVYGDTAVTTYYSVGTVQRPGSSTSERWSLRMTGVWVKQSGEWKLFHRHESPLVLR
jgi:ketosteroid isomerase-like protein